MIYYAFPPRCGLSQAIVKPYCVTWNQFIPLIAAYSVGQFRLIALPMDILLRINLGIWVFMYGQLCASPFLLTMLCALLLCREAQRPSVPYHYYEPLGPDECAMYISHERGRRGSHHRFITEKRVFANWARTFNIHFHQPDWSPRPLPRNATGSTVFPQPLRT